MPKNLLVNGEIVLYGPVGGSWWDDEGFTAADVLHTLSMLDGDVKVRLNSGGGLAWDGVAIFNALKAHDGRVTIQIDAIAASAASIIAMSGDEIIMRGGALMMIHDASTITWGNAEDLQKTVDMLLKLDGQMAAVYSKRTGLSREECAALMDAETWLTGEEAVEKGFATSTEDAEPAIASIFNYRAYAHAPEHLKAISRPFPERKPLPAAAAAHLEVDMTTAANAAAPAAGDTTNTNPAPQEDTRQLMLQILDRCEKAKLTAEETKKVVSAAKSVEAAADMILNIVCDRQEADGPEPLPHVRITADERDRFSAGVEKALLAKAGLDGGEVNEFSSYTLLEIARASLTKGGIKAPAGDKLAVVGAALCPPMASHGTSDFPIILGNVANKAMLKGYAEAETTFQLWTAKGSVSDFKSITRADTGFFPSLSLVRELEEFSYATFGEKGETAAIATYGKLFKISRQAIINDDLDAFSRVPRKMGAAARRTVNRMVYGILNANPNMGDGVALFHATHGNLASGAGNVGVTSDVYAKSLAAMRSQKEGEVTVPISPKFVLTPETHRSAVKQIFLSPTELGQANPMVPSKVAGEVVVIADPELDISGTMSTYLAADPNAFDTIEVLYLDGNEQPVLEQKDGWSIDGTEFKVRLDFGVKAFGWRGLRKIPVA